jgi:GNAT superfamily N-acetyltransferase
MQADLQFREITSEQDLHAIFPLVRFLRQHLTMETFLTRLPRQWAQGYVLVAGFAGARPVVAAGYRLTCSLSRGPHLFVDDLVTASDEQGKGYGAAMIQWLRRRARDAGVARVDLDSRDTAVGFYERMGFTFAASRPCSIPAEP